MVVEKHTTLQPKTLAGFTWQTSMLRTAAQRRALSHYFYENNRVGELVFDSPDYAVYRLDPRKLSRTTPSRESYTWAVSATAARSRVQHPPHLVSSVAGVTQSSLVRVSRATRHALAEARRRSSVVIRLDERADGAATAHFHLAKSPYRARLSVGGARASRSPVVETVHDVVPRTPALVPRDRVLRIRDSLEVMAVIVHSSSRGRTARELARAADERPVLEVIPTPDAAAATPGSIRGTSSARLARGSA